MLHMLGIVKGNVIIVHNETTQSPFESKAMFTPLRCYYDGLFNYTFMRRRLMRACDSVTDNAVKKHYSFDGLAGLTVDPSGEVYTHVLTSEYAKDDAVVVEQVGEFQGLLATLGDMWFGGDSYSVNAVTLWWEQTNGKSPMELFDLLEPTKSSSVELTIAKIPIPALIASIEMFSKGMYSDVEKLWTVTSYQKPVVVKVFDINNTQEFNTTNLGMVTAYYNTPTETSN